MKKYFFLALLFIAIGVVLYLTFVIALLEIAIGSIFLVVLVIALLILWRKGKKKLEE